MPMFILSTPQEIARELGTRLRQHRLAHGWRQRELAERAGVSEAILRKFEREGTGTLDSFIRVVAALGMTDQLTPLLDTRPRSIKAMEHASERRQRAPRRRHEKA